MGLACVVTQHRVSPILARMSHPLVAVPELSLTDPCQETEGICNWTYEQTGNVQLANAADWVVGKPSALIGLILIGLLVRWLLHRVIDRIVRQAASGVLPDRISRAVAGGKVGAALNLNEDAGYTRRVQRAQTMGSLLKSIVSGVVFTVVALMFISELGYDIAPLIASAGILGVALGFGSQALVKDFLSGIFMIFEDQYGVGDEVDLGEASGTVEAVSLRVTRLRDVNGTVWYVRNGEILRVGNMSQNWARTVLDIRVAYGEDLARVQRVARRRRAGPVGGRRLHGSRHRAAVGVGCPGARRRRGRRTPGPEDRAARAVGASRARCARRIKARFDHEGIEMPFPQQVVWMREGEGPRPQHSGEHEQPRRARPSPAQAD